MKRFLFLGIAATAMLASCTNDETVEMNPQNAIGFETFVDKSTRATDVTIDKLYAFEVYGWRTKNSNTEQIFDAQEVEVEENSNGEYICTYSPLQYWVEGYNYTFEAVAPKSGNKGVTFNGANGSSTITFVSDAETDLIYASNSRDLTSTSPTNTAVNLTFNHLLSRVKFTFTNGADANSAATITVSDVKITNAGNTATYSPFTNGGKWSAVTGSQEVEFASTDIADIAGGASEDTEHMYLIPCDVNNYQLSFKVTMTQKQNNNSTGVSDVFEYTDISLVSSTYTLEKGCSYNFKTTFNPGYPIEFTAEVTEWDDNNWITIP